MSSTDPVSSITNGYRLIVSYCPILTQYTASSSRNAQLSQLDLVHLSVVTFDKSGTCLGSSFDNIGRAEGAGHGHIYCSSFFTIAPAADGHITSPPLWAPGQH